MRDPRLDQLAELLVTYSTRVQPGEAALIDYDGPEARELAVACAEQVAAAGGVPVVEDVNSLFFSHFLRTAKEKQIERLGEIMLAQMKQCAVYIGIRGAGNIYELQGAPKTALDWYNKYIKIPVHLEQRVKRSKWVVLRFPNPSMAQLAERSTRDFAEFYFEACCFDYARMEKAAAPLKTLMERTDEVRLTGVDTDLRFSIKGIPAVPCCGQMNIPDGEVFTAPVRDSLNGTVRFNCKTTERLHGEPFERIRLTFQNGRVTDAEASTSERTEKLNEILDQDDGARFIGEFAIGFHPHIRTPMNDILFDEKIAGSFHMALGACYDEAPNGNKSALHWDLVQIQRPDYGGGEIWFDGKLVRKDGEFVLDELKGLNAENLAGG